MVMEPTDARNCVEVRDIPFATYLTSQKISGTVCITFDVVDGSPIFKYTDYQRVDILRAAYECNGVRLFCEKYYLAMRELELAVEIAAVATGHDDTGME